MAQLNNTLNQEEILSLLQENSGDAFKKLLQESLNAVLKAESKEQLKAEPYERTPRNAPHSHVDIGWNNPVALIKWNGRDALELFNEFG